MKQARNCNIQINSGTLTYNNRHLQTRGWWCHLPIVHLHVLSIEEEHSGRDVTDVKVSGVNWSLVDVDDVDGRHVAQVVSSF